MNAMRIRRTSRKAGVSVLFALAAVALFGMTVHARAGQASSPVRLQHRWRYWKYVREIRLPASNSPRLVALLVPPAVYARTEDHLDDLRIIDGLGDDVPYAKIMSAGSSSTTFLPSYRLESRYDAGSYTDFLLDLGPHPGPCNFLSVSAPARAANLAVLAEIDASNDGRHWHQIRKSAALFGSQATSNSPNPVLHFPTTTARYLLLRVFYGKGKFPLHAVAAGYQLETPADRAWVTGWLAPSASSTAETTVWQISLEGPIPADEVDFYTTQPEFSRQVNIFARENGEEWALVGDGTVLLVRRHGRVEKRTSVGFPSVRSRLWRVRLQNESDPPLSNVKLRLSMTPQRIVFRQEPGRHYRLLYGESEARPSQYDLAQTATGAGLRAAPLVASLGPEHTNADWVDPRPWTEKHASVLWVATILAALILGLAALRAARRPA